MSPGPEVVENEFTDAHRSASDARDFNINTRITVVPAIVDESPEVVIDE